MRNRLCDRLADIRPDNTTSLHRRVRRTPSILRCCRATVHDSTPRSDTPTSTGGARTALARCVRSRKGRQEGEVNVIDRQRIRSTRVSRCIERGDHWMQWPRRSPNGAVLSALVRCADEIGRRCEHASGTRVRTERLSLVSQRQPLARDSPRAVISGQLISQERREC